MSTVIPPRLDNPEPKERRFYIVTDSTVYLELQHEAHQRDTNLWTLGGAVLTAWLSAGCPSFSDEFPQSPSPSPSQSVADVKGDAE